MTTWSTTTQAPGRCGAVVRPGSGDGPLSVRPETRGQAEPARTGREPSPEVQQSSSEDRYRARCVPDRTVIPGISRSLRNNPPPELTCG
jgi:hypothetical protein